MSAVLQSLFDVSAALERAGVPSVSPFWRGEAARFYQHPSARLLVENVGRGGDKSRTSVMMAIAETLAGDFVIPPGERHYFTHVAENVTEAGKTLGVLEQYLRILRVPFTRSGDTIELGELARGFKVLASRVGAVSGWRCIGWTADEAAKWSNDGADPSEEIVASIRAMTVTHPSARGRIISSPLATVGYFHEVWSRGSTEDQVAGHAPSWVANPSITEAQTRKLERDPRKHAREYGAVPTEGTEESLFDAVLIDRAMRAEPGDVPPEAGVPYLASMDPSLGHNAWTLAVIGLRHVGDRRIASVVLTREWRAPIGGSLDIAGTLATIVGLVRPYGVRTVITDQWQAESMAAICTRLNLGIHLAIDKPTSTQKLQRYEDVVVRLMDQEVELPRDARVRADLIAVRRIVVASSADRFTIRLPITADGRHCDYAPSIVLGLSQISRATAQAAVEAERQRRGQYALQALNFDYPDEVLSLPENQRFEATLKLANGAPLQAVLDPDGYVRAARHAAQSPSGAYQRGRDEHDELLRRQGSSAWSGYKPPPEPSPEEQAALADLERRVQERLAGKRK